MLFTKASLSMAPPGVVQLPVTAQCTLQPAPVFLPPPFPNSEDRPPQRRGQHLVSMSKCQPLCQGTLRLHFIYVNISFQLLPIFWKENRFRLKMSKAAKSESQFPAIMISGLSVALKMQIPGCDSGATENQSLSLGPTHSCRVTYNPSLELTLFNLMHWSAVFSAPSVAESTKQWRHTRSRYPGILWAGLGWQGESDD